MPALPTPIGTDPEFTVLWLRGNQVSFATRTMELHYRLGRDVTLQAATLIDKTGERYSLADNGDTLSFDLERDFPVGPIVFELAIRQRGSDRLIVRSEYAVTIYELTGGEPTFTLGGRSFLTREEEFRTPGSLTILKPVELRQSASFDAVQTHPFTARFVGEMQASRSVVFAYAGERRPADHYLSVRREDDELLMLGLFDS